MNFNRFNLNGVNTGDELLARSRRLKLDLWHDPEEGETTCEFELHGSFEIKPDDDNGEELLRSLLIGFRTIQRKGGEANG